ncbi:MAG TPA: hypothetical protein VKT71_10350 [Candidatus Acidoferrales bacterium]|nr:hypothetical protein [Candidatus Acidoferrales bacterium]
MKLPDMTRKELARITLKAAATTLGILVCATVFLQTARADCGSYTSLGWKPMSIPTQRLLLKPAAYRVARLAVGDDDRDRDRDATIVGLWKFSFTAKGNAGNPAPFNPPDGATLDAGYVQWHSDRTEIMNSGRDPASSSFCLGVWKSTGRSSYKLNHFALSWDATGKSCTPPPQPDATGCFEGPTNIREEVTVDHTGNHYDGTVTIDQYDPTGMTLLFELKGTVSADRITAD